MCSLPLYIRLDDTRLRGAQLVAQLAICPDSVAGLELHCMGSRFRPRTAAAQPHYPVRRPRRPCVIPPTQQVSVCMHACALAMLTAAHDCILEPNK